MNSSFKEPIALETFLQSLSCGVCKVSLEHDYPILYANQYYSELFGTSSEGNARQFVLAEDFLRVDQEIRSNISKRHNRFDVNHRGICQDGSIRYFMSRCTWSGAEPQCLSAVLIDITEQKKLEQELSDLKEEYRIAFQNTEHIINIFDVETRTLYQSHGKDTSFCIADENSNIPESLVNTEFIAPDNKTVYRDFFYSMIDGTPNGRALTHMLNADGTYHWYDVRYTMVYTDDGKPSKAILSYIDVTEQQEKELAYRRWISYFSAQRKDSYAYCEYNLTQDMFECVEDRTGFLPKEPCSLEEAVRHCLKNIPEDDCDAFQSVFNRQKMLMCNFEGSGELLSEYRLCMNHTMLWISSVIQMITDPASKEIKAFILFKNIDRDKQAQEFLRKSMECDPLTGTLNRASYMRYVTSCLKEDDNVSHAFIMFDIDHFKQINDSSGHPFGDQVLRDMAASIKKNLRKDDLFGRMGGDEFSIFFRNIPSVEIAKKRLAQLQCAASKKYTENIQVTVSMGLSFYPQDGGDFQQLYQHADCALYRAKNNGRNQSAIYNCLIDRHM